MKARILPLGDLAEYGKTNSVALLISMTPQEARAILDKLADPTGLEEEPYAVKLLFGYLGTVAGRHGTSDQFAQEMVNTDGRSGVHAGNKHPDS